MQKIGPYYWVRVCVMAITLVAVIGIIYRLNNPDGQGLMSFLGGGMRGEQIGSVNLCPTRVSSLSVVGKFALIQDGMKWYRLSEGQREEVDSIAVEKWFAEYCKVKADPVAQSPSETPLQPVVTLAYVAGMPVTIQQSLDGIFAWGGKYFRSAQLEQGLNALPALPAPKTPGQQTR